MVQTIHMMKSKTRRPNKWPSSGKIFKACSLTLIVSLLLIGNGSEALLKSQHQQRSDDSQQVGQPQSSSSQQHHQSSQSAYQNHQSQQLGSSAAASSSSSSSSSGAISQNSPQSPTSYSSSVSISSSSPSGGLSGLPSASVSGGSSQGSSASGSGQATRGVQDQLSAYSSYGGSGSSASQKQQQQSSLSYADLSGAASANAPDSSYQAAANSVNMALANSGIFGPTSSYSPSPSSGSASSSAGQSVGSQQQQSLNPLHYFYYPSKEAGGSTGAAAGGATQAKASGGDMMSNSASNNYNSMAAYPTYADQLNSALSSIGPDVAASSQDPSYLPQPNTNSMQNSNSMLGGDLLNGQQGGQMFNNGQQGQQMSSQQQQGQTNGIHPSFNSAIGDLNAYSSNINQATGPQQQQQQPSSSSSASSNGISFNGPTSGSGNAQSSGDLFGMGQTHSGHQQQQLNQQQQQQQQQSSQQIPSMGTYQSSNLYNQLGDLSTSNFGNNAGGLSSVASYMPPNQQHSAQHDLFGTQSAASLLGAGNGQQFSSAASSLTPAAVSPPGLQGQQGASSSLFGGSSSLFGQQSPAGSSTGSNLFSNQHYLNSFLSPQQYGQLTGQQMPSSGQLDQQTLSAAATSPTATSVAASGSSKRYGIGSFIVPMLALAGLSLLIPTMSNIGTAVGRKKRSIEDKITSSSRQQQISFDPINGVSQMAKEMSIGEYMDKIERYYSIYKNAVENDDCLNRLICEFGDAVKDITGKSAVVTVIEKLAPNWMTGKVHLFKEAALNNKEGKEKCKKYVCHSNKRH